MHARVLYYYYAEVCRGENGVTRAAKGAGINKNLEGKS
jgi:hypothetical protein